MAGGGQWTCIHKKFAPRAEEKTLATCPSNLVDLLHSPHSLRFLLFSRSRCHRAVLMCPPLQHDVVRTASVEAVLPR